jgi:hypothetical protein
MHPACTAPLERSSANVVFSAALAKVPTASATPIANSTRYLFMDFAS